MPRPRRVKTEAAQPEEVSQSQNQQKVVEVKHKTEWSELRPVDEALEGADLTEDFEIEDDRPRRKTAKNERDELRKKLSQNNVTPASNLKLTIEKYSHSEVMDGAGGMSGDTEHCTKYPCVESHITSEDYLDIARKWGAGMYRFTLRMQNKIVTAWDKRISAGASSSIVQHVNPADPNSPQVIVNMPEGVGHPVGVIDPMKQAREFAKTYKELKQVFEPEGTQPAQPAQSIDPEVILLQNLASNEKFMDKVNGGLIKKLFGDGAVDDEPSWSAVGMEAVKSGQLAGAIDAAFRGLAGLVNMILPRRDNNNGQAPMAQTPIQTNESTDSQRATDGRTVVAQEIPQGNQSLQPASGEANREGGMLPVASPAEQALAIVIADCQKKIPPQVTFTNLMAFADAVNVQAPAYSIDGWIEYFGGMPIDDAIEFVKTLPNGEAVASLPHAKEWTEQLQKLIKDSQEGEDE